MIELEMYAPRELMDSLGNATGKWHYTLAYTSGNRGAFAVGHCAEGCPGHDTPEEAIEHYRQYLIDGAEFKRHPEDIDTLNRCAHPDCKNWSVGRAVMNKGWGASLCEEHFNREALREFYKIGRYS